MSNPKKKLDNKKEYIPDEETQVDPDVFEKKPVFTTMKKDVSTKDEKDKQIE